MSAVTTSAPAVASAFAFSELAFRVSARGAKELSLSAMIARTRPPPWAPVAPTTVMIFLSAMTISPLEFRLSARHRARLGPQPRAANLPR